MIIRIGIICWLPMEQCWCFYLQSKQEQQPHRVICQNNKLPSTFLQRWQSYPTHILYGFIQWSTQCLWKYSMTTKPESGPGLFTIHHKFENKIFMRTKSQCREDLHFFYSCITGAYHGKKTSTFKELYMIFIQIIS